MIIIVMSIPLMIIFGKMERKMNPYERIKELCSERGISIRNLEESLGFSYGAISKWATSDPGYAKIEMVAKSFGVRVEYIMHGADFYADDEAARIGSEILTDRDLRALFEASKDARPEDLQMAAEMLKRFRQNDG